MNSIRSYEHKKILICGAAGVSGRAAASLCIALGAKVLLLDQKPIAKKEQLLSIQGKTFPANRLIDLGGDQSMALLDRYSPDTIIVAPGIAQNIEILQAARKRGIPIRSENDFGFECIQKRSEQEKTKMPYVFAITGTDGKSTTTAILTHIINHTTPLRAIACGNFGRPLSDIAVLEEKVDALVVECSSFQLEEVCVFRPHTALLLNLAQDHGERYPRQEDYFLAKLNIAKNQTKEDLFIVSSGLIKKVEKELQLRCKQKEGGGSSVHGMPRLLALDPPSTENMDLFFAGKNVPGLQKSKFRGLHNLTNVAFALAAFDEFVSSSRIPYQIEKINEALGSFCALEHRLEFVASMPLANDYTLECYNDSKATTVHALRSAQESFAGQRIYLLCGGRDKGGDFSQIVKNQQDKNGSGISYTKIFAFGEAAEKIAQQTGTQFIFPDLESAFEAAWDCAEEDSKSCHGFSRTEREKRGIDKEKDIAILLLSPGCSSFDAYENYVQRGKHFRELLTKRSQS